LAAERRAGILLPVSALPSPYGIGDLGEAAYRFIDFLAAAKQRIWQVLPLHPTGFGDSPYQSPSAFAGNPYYISLDALVRQELLMKKELPQPSCGKINYEELFTNRYELLLQAYLRFDTENENFRQFCKQNSFWLFDYALFSALKEQFGYVPFTQFPTDLRDRTPEAILQYGLILKHKIEYYQFLQYQFFIQWQALKTYANDHGVSIIGDIPLYVAADSADVWANAELFHLNADRTPTVVAGVPPDAFSASGQRWGNPIYDYDAMAKEQFAWWKQRIRICSSLYDGLRIDHFIGIARYWEIPADSPTAESGIWRAGPGEALLNAIEETRGNTFILAEDLGVVHESVTSLLKSYRYPGMKVLLFAADGGADNPFLPHRYVPNSVVYTGTHDNDTIIGFAASHTKEELVFLMDYIGAASVSELPERLIRTAFASVSNTAVIPIQDWLKLDSHARINTPSTMGTNWQWRMEPGALTDELCRTIRHLTELYGRE